MLISAFKTSSVQAFRLFHPLLTGLSYGLSYPFNMEYLPSTVYSLDLRGEDYMYIPHGLQFQ